MKCAICSRQSDEKPAAEWEGGAVILSRFDLVDPVFICSWHCLSAYADFGFAGQLPDQNEGGNT